MPVDPSQTPQAVMDPQESSLQLPSSTEDGASAPAQPMKSPSPELQPVAQAPAPTPEQQAAVAQHARHTAVGRFFHGLVNSGSRSSASNFWRSLIGGALVGMGAADDAPVVARGPYGDVQDNSVGGAASRGFRGGAGYVEQQQDRQRKQAKEQKEEQRRDAESKIQQDDAVLRKHADARAQQMSIQNSVEDRKSTRLNS